MANFNLSEYETVEERHARALAAYPDLRCVVRNHTTPADRAASTWVVEARVYLNADEQEKICQRRPSGRSKLTVSAWLTRLVR